MLTSRSCWFRNNRFFCCDTPNWAVNLMDVNEIRAQKGTEELSCPGHHPEVIEVKREEAPFGASSARTYDVFALP